MMKLTFPSFVIDIKYLPVFFFIIIKRVMDCFFSPIHSFINVSHYCLFLIVCKPKNSHKRTYHFKNINHMTPKGWHQNDLISLFPFNFLCPFTHFPLLYIYKHVSKSMLLFVCSLQSKKTCCKLSKSILHPSSYLMHYGG